MFAGLSWAGCRGPATQPHRSCHSRCKLPPPPTRHARYLRVFLVVAFTVALKGPAPALLYARTAAWYTRWLLRPWSRAAVSPATTFTLRGEPSSPLVQYRTWGPKHDRGRPHAQRLSPTWAPRWDSFL